MTAVLEIDYILKWEKETHRKYINPTTAIILFVHYKLSICFIWNSFVYKF